MIKPRLFLLGPLLALLILVTACSSGSASPEPEPTATEQALPPTATVPAQPANQAGPTGPGPEAGIACPVAVVICEFGVQIEAALEAGDAEAIFALATPVNATCRAGANNLSAALCEGAAEGEVRPGYWALQGGVGTVVTEAELRVGLDRWFDSISRAGGTSDIYGPGELQIGSISCTRHTDQAPGTCLGNSIQVHFTFINPEEVRGTGTPGQRISFHVSASVVDGMPRANGFGTVAPPNRVLQASTLNIQDGQGNPLLVEVYPWTH